MPMTSVLIFALLVLLAIPGHAQQACSGIFSSSKEIFQSHHLMEIQTRKESLGQEVLVLQRKSEIQKKLFRKEKEVQKDWADFSINPDKPGDVRWGAQHLGPAMKTLLGLKTFDQQGKEVAPTSDAVFYTQTPSVPTILHSFKLLEAKMKQQNPEFQWIGFFQTGAGTLSGKTYVEKIVKDGTMPISSQGHLYEHDLNYHVYSSFVMPPQFVKALRSRMEVFMGFVKYMEAQPGTKENAQVRYLLEQKLLEEVVSRVDTATGNFFKTVIRDSDKGLNHTMNEVFDSLDIALLSQLSPREYFLELTGSKDWGADLNKAAREYARTLPESAKQQDLPDFYFKNPAEFYNQANSLFKALEKAASEVIAERPQFP